MAEQTLELSIRGVHTYNSELSGVPKGALKVGRNISLNRLNLAEPRRGFNILARALPGGSDRAQVLLDYSGGLMAHTGTELYYDNGSAWVSRGTVSPVSGQKLRYAIGNRNLYLATSAGIYKTDSLSTSVSLAGIPKAIHMTLTLDGASGFLANNYRVGYRHIFGRYDANDNLIQGGVSQKSIIDNTSGGTRNVRVRCYFPAGLSAGDFLQVYRTLEVTGSSVQPDEEYQLCYEVVLSSSDLTTGYFEFVDIVDEDLLGDFLYTSTSQGGIANDHAVIPFARDICVYKQSLFYASPRYRHSLQITLLATGTNGLQDGDTVTFTRGSNVVTYTAKTTPRTFTFPAADVTTGTDSITEASHGLTTGLQVKLSSSGSLPSPLNATSNYWVIVVDANTFKLATSRANALANSPIDLSSQGTGTHTLTVQTDFRLYTGGTAATDIRDTVYAFVAAINQNAEDFVYAYYLSGSNDLPGKVLIQARDLTDTEITITSSRSQTWQPALASPATNLNTTSSSEYKNGLVFSEQGQSEHVPLANVLFIGKPDKYILRILPLRDAIIILKEDGAYVLRGDDKFSFSVTELDLNAILLAPECVTVGNNTCYAYLDTGFAAITDNAVTIISIPIKDQLLAIQGTALDETIALSHAQSYDTEGKIFFWVPESDGDTFSEKAWVYDFYNEEFVEWSVPALSAVIYDKKLYLGDPSTNKVKVERKTLTFQDICDYGQSVTIVSQTTVTLVLSSVTDMAPGDILSQGSDFAYIVSVDNTGSSVTVDLNITWDTLSPLDHLKGIPVEITWNPDFAGNPAGYKHYQEAIILFKRGFLKEATLSFYSDLYSGVQPVECEAPAGTGAFGIFDFGDGTFGGEASQIPVRKAVPRNAAKCDLLYVTFSQSVAWSDFQLNGLSLVYNPISVRMTR